MAFEIEDCVVNEKNRNEDGAEERKRHLGRKEEDKGLENQTTGARHVVSSRGSGLERFDRRPRKRLGATDRRGGKLRSPEGA